MKPEIRAMLPELPFPCGYDQLFYRVEDIKAWLDKLTEGAEKVEGWKCDTGEFVWGDVTGGTRTALLICPREIKNQTPLEIAKEYLKLIADKMPSCDCMDAPGLAKDALAQIEAAK